MIGEAPTRALELDAQQTGAHPLGESGDAATLESEEMLEGAARALGRFGKEPAASRRSVATDDAAAPPMSRSRRATAQRDVSREAEPLAAVRRAAAPWRR